MAWTITASLGKVLTAGFALLLIGFVIGGWVLPRVAESLQAVSGKACVRDEDPADSYIEDDEGNFTAFDADAMWWSNGSEHGYGRPPCLRKAPRPFDKCAEVRAGGDWGEHPGSAGDEQIVWMECLE